MEPPVSAEPTLGEPSIGHQVNSLRPSSARYSFSREGRPSSARRHQQDVPGPGAYNVVDYESALSSASAFVGTSVARSSTYAPPASDQGVESQGDPYLEPWDGYDSKYPTPPCAVFGTEPRNADVSDLELLRECPEMRYGRLGPGHVYDPDDRKARPKSAGPCYSVPRARSASKASLSAAPSVAPNSYQRHDQETMGGVQRSSKRRTSRASSFGRASRFPAPKPAEGSVSAECSNVMAAFGSSEAGRKQRRPPAATFGCAPRDGGRAAGPAEGRPPSARLGPPCMPHPSIAPRKEILKFCPVGRR
eukprot:TRINITY_DN29665_c0_g1_i1.p1 TRINITY_DN29665_c0_g1~~TRINITY_DN29665_c0_g1_i1.p1  ORF type:complete len:305 (+),score=45.14 TRINITY_DN29665_c0_g1_i1:94-1008(+)